jgi:hypothetical protein
MAETPAQEVKALFKRWRSGDADAGVSMAQRFSDWYYAITVMRLGDQQARVPLERACQMFAQRIMDITNADELIDFAHRIVLDEVRQAGGRAQGSDSPNAMTNGQPPSALLAKARAGLPPEQIQILNQIYAGSTAAGDPAPSPIEALQARHALKVWLSRNAKVPFTVLPSEPVLDHAPLPLYEGACLQSDDEERMFEHWLLRDIELCKDIAEFLAFAYTIRAGALQPKGDQSMASKAAAKTTPRTQPVDGSQSMPSASPAAGPAMSTEPAPASGAARFISIAVLGAVIVGAFMLAKIFLG